MERVKSRLLRATAALENAGVTYAVIGGNAIAAWVGRIDESVVRFTQVVDLLIRRTDFEATKAVLEPAGFRYRHSSSIEMFLDGPDAKARDAVHVIFAGERVRPEYALPAPDVAESEPSQSFRVLSLAALVRMKLTSFRDKDRTHLRDLAGVGLVPTTPGQPSTPALTSQGDCKNCLIRPKDDQCDERVARLPLERKAGIARHQVGRPLVVPQ